MKNRTIQNKKVLITGGAGFIGSNLIDRLLEQNNKVICLDNCHRQPQTLSHNIVLRPTSNTEAGRSNKIKNC